MTTIVRNTTFQLSDSEGWSYDLVYKNSGEVRTGVKPGIVNSQEAPNVVWYTPTNGEPIAIQVSGNVRRYEFVIDIVHKDPPLWTDDESTKMWEPILKEIATLKSYIHGPHQKALRAHFRRDFSFVRLQERLSTTDIFPNVTQNSHRVIYGHVDDSAVYHSVLANIKQQLYSVPITLVVEMGAQAHTDIIDSTTHGRYFEFTVDPNDIDAQLWLQFNVQASSSDTTPITPKAVILNRVIDTSPSGTPFTDYENVLSTTGRNVIPNNYGNLSVSKTQTGNGPRYTLTASGSHNFWTFGVPVTLGEERWLHNVPRRVIIAGMSSQPNTQIFINGHPSMRRPASRLATLGTSDFLQLHDLGYYQHNNWRLGTPLGTDERILWFGVDQDHATNGNSDIFLYYIVVPTANDGDLMIVHPDSDQFHLNGLDKKVHNKFGREIPSLGNLWTIPAGATSRIYVTHINDSNQWDHLAQTKLEGRIYNRSTGPAYRDFS